MEDNDLEPQRTKPPKPVLDSISIEELGAYIVDLEEEILRARAEIDKKLSHRKNIEGIFKT